LAGDTIRNAAIAAALGIELRRAPRQARRRRFRLPLTWLTDANLGAEDIFANPERATALQPRAIGRIVQALKAANQGRFRASAMPALSAATMARAGASERAPWQRVARIAIATLAWRL
jgi:hypothetical protein